MNTHLGRILVVGGAAVLLTGAGAAAPLALRRADAFRVAHVEVTGTRLLPVADAIAASGITAETSVFDSAEPWRLALLDHPMVADARIERRLPGTVRLELRETEPVALARTPELVPVDAQGRLLPIDPAAAGLDLPVLSTVAVPGAAGRLDETGRRLAEAAALVRRLDPALAGWISELAPAAGMDVRWVLRSAGAPEVWLPALPSPRMLQQVRLTLADLAARGELGRLTRLDARGPEQVIVKLQGGGAVRDETAG
ncbi:MAG: FtsQ-type POTRA domain-containing protein [Gemmatimonadota bacterium]